MITYLTLCYLLILSLEEALCDKSAVVIIAKGLIGTDPQLENIIQNEQFVKWSVITGEVKYKDIENSSLIILVKVNPAANFTEEEIRSIVKWFNKGYKVLWLSSEGDYGEGFLRQVEINKILEAIGSRLRVEYATVQDPFLNAGTVYRVFAVPCGPSWAKALTKNVRRVLFHTPSPIIALVNNTYVKLEERSIPYIYAIMCSSNRSFIADFNPPSPQAHVVGEVGSTVLMALEVFDDIKSIVIVSGSAPFNHFTGMYMPSVKDPVTYKGIKEEGASFVRNIIMLGANPHLLLEVSRLVSQMVSKDRELTYLQRKKSMLEEEIKKLTSEIEAREEEITNLNSELKITKDSLKEFNELVKKLVKELSLLKLLLLLSVICSFILGLSIHKLSKPSIEGRS